MKKTMIIMAILTAIVSMAIILVPEITDATEGWYDEETKLGWNPKDGWYYVLETYDDLSEEEKPYYSENFKYRLVNLSEDMRKFILQEYYNNR